MAYSDPFLRLVLIGTLYDTEDFTFSLSLISIANPQPAVPSEVPQAIIDACAAYFAAPSMISQAAELVTLKLNLIGTDGRYVGDETVFYDYPTPIRGSASNNIVPQVAYVVSLTTDAARGRAHAGRYYLPTPGPGVSAAGYLDPTNVGIMRGPTITFLNAINAAISDWDVGIVSDIGTGQARRVTGAKFGRVLDTMRSRRNKFTEEYSEADLA